MGWSAETGRHAPWTGMVTGVHTGIPTGAVQEAVAMKKTVWRSLRTRIALLALVTCAFLATAAGSLVSLIRNSHAATVRSAQRHLPQVATALDRAYRAQAVSGVSLREVKPPHPPPDTLPRPVDLPGGPHPKAGATTAGPLREGPWEAEMQGPPPPRPPPLPADPLSSVTAGVLRKEDGIEGGFLAGAGPLLGYAFPTHEGPGPQTEMPQRERPTIVQLARAAESTGAAQQLLFEGSHDVVLFFAQPVRETVKGREQVTGAVWLMQRLPDLNRGRRQQLLLTSLSFGAAALVTALLAGFVTVEIRGGVNAVTRHLARLEEDLTDSSRAGERSQLAEFEQVLGGVDAMAVALQRRIANQRLLEEQLQHQERLSSLGQFAAGVAHELRNPLATIRLRAQMAHQAAPEGVVARSSQVILEEVDRLDTMIGRLLQFARPISLEVQLLDVGELCAAVATAWQQRAPKGVQVSATGPRHMEVMADRSRLVQVLDNLVENAVQASKATGSEVVIRTTKLTHAVQIAVEDGGSGFSPAALRHAFDPFFTTKDTGTGLGLSIAFELAQAHGGELSVAPRPEGGAVVTLTLPTSARSASVTADDL